MRGGRVWHNRRMSDSKQRPPERDGEQPDGAPEPDRDDGAAGLPRAKHFYITEGYGFGPKADGGERPDAPQERDRVTGVADLPPAKLRYVIRGYGFGRVRGGEDDRAVAGASSANGGIESGEGMGVSGLPPAKLHYIFRA